MSDTKRHSRRAVLSAAAAAAATSAVGCDDLPPPPEEDTLTKRTLGNTGLEVEAISLGGEGVLRASAASDAVPMIEEAIRLGVKYCDTSPEYGGSEGYYGEALDNLGSDARAQIILASKSRKRTRDEALAELDQSLARLHTDHLDIWQLHNITHQSEVDAIFAPGGAIEAFEQARDDGRVRFIGATGHASAALLLEVMDRFPIDTVLCPTNPSDPARAPFLDSVVPEARARGIGIIGMKAMAAGRILADGVATPRELLAYAATHADTVIVGCSSIQEVRENLDVRVHFNPLATSALTELETRLAPNAERYDYFKG